MKNADNKCKGAKLLIINQEPTPLDAHATWKLDNKAAETLAAVAALIS